MGLGLFIAFCCGAGFTAALIVRRVTPRARRIVGAVLVLAALPLVVTFAALAAHVANDWRLARFSAQLFAFPLPAGARELARDAKVGLLLGNGNHCDFVATRELTAPQSLDAVRMHFSGLRLRPAIGGGADGGLPAVTVTARANGRFIVTAEDAPYEGIFDFRCL